MYFWIGKELCKKMSEYKKNCKNVFIVVLRTLRFSRCIIYIYILVLVVILDIIFHLVILWFHSFQSVFVDGFHFRLDWNEKISIL